MGGLTLRQSTLRVFERPLLDPLNTKTGGGTPQCV